MFWKKIFFLQTLSEKRLEVAQKILAAFSEIKITYPGGFNFIKFPVAQWPIL